jgi:hypothetical protein
MKADGPAFPVGQGGSGFRQEKVASPRRDKSVVSTFPARFRGIG